MSNVITADNLPEGSYGFYRKTTLTRMSDFKVPAGTTIQTPEGPFTTYEPSHIAFDSEGGIYPIAETVHRASYKRAQDAPHFR